MATSGIIQVVDRTCQFRGNAGTAVGVVIDVVVVVRDEIEVGSEC